MYHHTVFPGGTTPYSTNTVEQDIFTQQTPAAPSGIPFGLPLGPLVSVRQ